MLPPDWRERVLEWVRGAEEPDPSWFRGGPHLSPREQIEVYRQQYRWRLFDAVVEEIPGLWHLLGDEGGDLVRAYLADCPSTAWTLNRVADRLPEWLDARGAPRVQVEMARLDRAVMKGFEAASGRTPTPAQLSGMPRLALQPHVHLLRQRHAVHRYRSAVLSQRDPEPISEGDFPIVVFRRGIRMRHLEVEPDCWEVLRALSEHGDIGAALEARVAAGTSPEALAPRVGEWFRMFAERDLVEVSP